MLKMGKSFFGPVNKENSNQCHEHDNQRVPKGEEKADTMCVFAIINELAGNIIDGRNVVNVKSMLKAECER